MKKKHIIEKVKATIERERLIEKGDQVILGLSGGPDSLCLFFVLQALANEYEFALSAVHVNHKIRPGAAEEDQAFVETLCRKQGIPCTAIAADCRQTAKEEGLTAEEAGRKLRYHAFRQAASALKAQGIPAERIKIVVAQNMNDQAETLLMRILRGTGTDGLAGMDYRRDEGEFTVIRPLLEVSRDEIEIYCREKGLSPRRDRTNEEPVYTRNKIRLELLPLLAKKYNASIADALLRLAQSAREDREFMQKLAEAEMEKLRLKPQGENPGQVTLSRSGLRELSPALRHRVMRMAFFEVGLLQDVQSAHLLAADRLASSQGASGTVHFPEGFRFAVSYCDAVVLAPENSVAKEPREEWVLKWTPLSEEAARECKTAFDEERLRAAGRLDLRTRMPGDVFQPRGMIQGKKKLQDFLVDRKIPKEDRDKLLLACIGSEAAAIMDPAGKVRGEVSEKWKADANTKRAVVLELEHKL